METNRLPFPLRDRLNDLRKQGITTKSQLDAEILKTSDKFHLHFLELCKHTVYDYLTPCLKFVLIATRRRQYICITGTSEADCLQKFIGQYKETTGFKFEFKKEVI